MVAAAPLFAFRPERTLTGLATEPTPAQGALARGRADDGTARPPAAGVFSLDHGAQACEHDLADPFIVFQFSSEPDAPAPLASDPILLPTHGLLAPAAIAPADFAALTHDNPLNDLAYAVFQLKMKSGQLDPAFSFRG